MNAPEKGAIGAIWCLLPRCAQEGPTRDRVVSLPRLLNSEFMLTPKLERGYTSAQQWTPGRGGAIQLSEIKVRENETFESARRRFNKKIKQNGVLSEVRRREHYEKPSVKRKKKIAAARKRRARTT